MTLIVWDDKAETREQALARYEKGRGVRVRGPVVYIITGVPRGGLD